ncbi:uncharacterized protein DSM5745_01500 [Aspergillus mulundensis]|uniref:Uncharacterized protein n=1 Tax=Aspergillus mulundensis TaxID=1810919 RepID=A0A3D8T855_9EURO|nr:Uncharacterized protein DSM5745_01500 [Aspergillus mulundensis]RDW94178.1 Uncharacterized protein DSM5745_01500 [Aspergillus mulundensis]
MPPAIPWRLLGGTLTTGGACTILSFIYITREIEFIPLAASDPIFHSEHFKQCNPNGNPTIHDLHVQRVPLSRIDPSLRADHGRLLERYCGGVWGGLGFAPQRLLLTRAHKHKDTTSPASLWTHTELLASAYQPGTDIAGHFEVVERSVDSILIRGGDEISNRGLRPLDGLIELSASVDHQRDVVEFGCKTVFFQGLGETRKLPMPEPVIWLHELYARALLASGVRNVLG